MVRISKVLGQPQNNRIRNRKYTSLPNNIPQNIQHLLQANHLGRIRENRFQRSKNVSDRNMILALIKLISHPNNRQISGDRQMLGDKILSILKKIKYHVDNNTISTLVKILRKTVPFGPPEPRIIGKMSDVLPNENNSLVLGKKISINNIKTNKKFNITQVETPKFIQCKNIFNDHFQTEKYRELINIAKDLNIINPHDIRILANASGVSVENFIDSLPNMPNAIYPWDMQIFANDTRVPIENFIASLPNVDDQLNHENQNIIHVKNQDYYFFKRCLPPHRRAPERKELHVFKQDKTTKKELKKELKIEFSSDLKEITFCQKEDLNVDQNSTYGIYRFQISQNRINNPKYYPEIFTMRIDKYAYYVYVPQTKSAKFTCDNLTLYENGGDKTQYFTNTNDSNWLVFNDPLNRQISIKDRSGCNFFEHKLTHDTDGNITNYYISNRALLGDYDYDKCNRDRIHLVDNGILDFDDYGFIDLDILNNVENLSDLNNLIDFNNLLYNTNDLLGYINNLFNRGNSLKFLKDVLGNPDIQNTPEIRENLQNVQNDQEYLNNLQNLRDLHNLFNNILQTHNEIANPDDMGLLSYKLLKNLEIFNRKFQNLHNFNARNNQEDLINNLNNLINELNNQDNSNNIRNMLKKLPENPNSFYSMPNNERMFMYPMETVYDVGNDSCYAVINPKEEQILDEYFFCEMDSLLESEKEYANFLEATNIPIHFKLDKNKNIEGIEYIFSNGYNFECKNDINQALQTYGELEHNPNIESLTERLLRGNKPETLDTIDYYQNMYKGQYIDSNNNIVEKYVPLNIYSRPADNVAYLQKIKALETINALLSNKENGIYELDSGSGVRYEKNGNNIACYNSDNDLVFEISSNGNKEVYKIYNENLKTLSEEIEINNNENIKDYKATLYDRNGEFLKNENISKLIVKETGFKYLHDNFYITREIYDKFIDNEQTILDKLKNSTYSDFEL